MKKLMMIAIMMIAAVSANAQNEAGQASIKPMAGINLATMTKTNDSKMRVGLAAGLEFEYGVTDNFGISAGVLYSMQGVKGKEYWLGSNAKADITYKFDYINVPILANYYIVKGLAIKAGVQPGFNVKKKVAVEVAGVKDDATVDDVKGFALSIPMGLSYEFSNVVLDARYNLGVTKAIKDIDSKHSYFTITLGYRIPF
jgi:hypothetical protein